MRGGKKRSRSKKRIVIRRGGGFLYYEQIWWDALNDLRIELQDHCLNAKPDKLRFQTGRLFENLGKRIVAAGRDLLKTMYLCYSLVTDRCLQLGYDEPRRLHFEEHKALVAIPRTQRASWVPKSLRDIVGKLSDNVLLFALLDSICSWIEAQESLTMWLSFERNRTFWRGDPHARWRAFQAEMLADLSQRMIAIEIHGRQITGASLWGYLGRLGIGLDPEGVPWSRRQWANILEQAARRAENGQASCMELERWVWWCYPVFSRYRWSAGEVLGASCSRGFAEVAEKLEADFRRYWMTRGLRFTGTRTNRRSPPLAEFVKTVSIPNLDNVRGVPIWGWD